MMGFDNERILSQGLHLKSPSELFPDYTWNGASPAGRERPSTGHRSCQTNRSRRRRRCICKEQDLEELFVGYVGQKPRGNSITQAMDFGF